MIKLTGSVGYGGDNRPGDVAIIQTLLKNARGYRRYFTDIPTGLYGYDLGQNIEKFQIEKKLVSRLKSPKEKGFLEQSSLTFKTLLSSTDKDFHSLKVHFVNQFYPVFFCREKALDSVPEIPSTEELRMPDLMATRVQAFLKKAITEFSVQNIDISNEGQFCVTLKTEEKFYDAGLNKIISKPSASYIKYVLKNITIKEFNVDITPAGALLLKSKKFSFFTGPHVLDQCDKKRLKYWNIPASGKVNFDTYQKKLISSAIRPWRKIKRVDNADFYQVPQGLIKPSSKQYAFLASQALAHYGDHSGIIKAYDEIFRRQGATAGRQPLIVVYAAFEAQIIVGVNIQAGMIFDPSTQKEYFFVKAGIGLSLGAAFGFSAAIETENRTIKELFASQGLSFGSSFSNQIDLGPLSINFSFKNARVKFPDVEWKGFKGIPASLFGDEADVDVSGNSIKINKKSLGDVQTGNFLQLSADTITGERLKRGEESSLEKAKRRRQHSLPSKTLKGRVKRELFKLEYPIANVDVGPVVLDIALKPKLSGKVKLEFGPEIHGDYYFITEYDLDFGWLEDGVYSLLRAYLPPPTPLFPLN